MTFGGLLRRLRTDAGLTQEELAEAASVSTRSVSDLERGVNLTARKDTARLLADALHLTGPARAGFEAAARGRGEPGAGEAGAIGTAGAVATRALPRDIASFTGRQRQLQELVDALLDSTGVVSIHAIGGMAGIGKTAFAVHAAHRLADRFPAGQIFLPLHGHTPGERPVDPGDALASLLLMAGVTASQIPPGVEARMALWRDRLAEANALTDLGDLRELTGDNTGAVQALERALDLYRDLGDRFGQAWALNDLGIVRRLTGDYPKAVEALEQTLGICRDLGNRLGQANALKDLGATLSMTGDQPGAARALEQALDIYREVGNRSGEAEALNETGTPYRVSGDPSRAEDCHQQALKLARAIPSSRDEACALAGLGRCANAAGRPTLASTLLRQAHDIFQRIGAAETAGVLAELDTLSPPETAG